MRLNLGIRRRLAPLLQNDRRKIELANSLLFTLPGSPFLYYGDEIGMGDNIWLDDRDGLRTPMQWSARECAGFSTAPPEKWYAPLIDQSPYTAAQVNVAVQQVNPDSLLNTLRGMIRVRKAHHAFGWGTFEWLASCPVAVAGYWRIYQSERLLVLNNLSMHAQTIEVERGAQDLPLCMILSSPGVEPVSGSTPSQLVVTLNPYQYIWMVA
jgi:maltose alpha-D-glucosyltransferase/alpha-amylase